ncbi:unnamed protein product [Rotaria magnacalcarata]|nr:unnamed protein product [Rotaria magnacalcarata]CAF1672313.1 unnamed protein product [Rotaria magnacalcarata]CAF2059707.1 unnamed protein product [Rotaria magnacalcarata]CAF2164420.1 unnamed protein product [Rotaria magnacalcarata]CAF3806543.1 unnamed protein product [Rotaria magnacalcarata]
MASRINQTTRNSTEQQEDLQKLAIMLENSDYPKREINKLIQESLRNTKLTSSTTTNAETKTQKEKNFKYMITIPYVPGAEVLKRRLEMLDIQVFFSYPQKIGSYFNKSIRSGTESIVYGIQCGCKQVYIGETKVGIQQRMKQHERSILKNEPNSNSEIVQHIQKKNPRCQFNTQNVYIIDRDTQWKKRRYKEAIYSIINESINRHEEIDSGWLPLLHSKKQELQKRTKIKTTTVVEQGGDTGTEEDTI